MKVQQWRLKKMPVPRTLADVPSSREKPVLCWWNDYSIAPSFVDSDHVGRIERCGMPVVSAEPGGASELELYDQSSRPTKLEDVPDRRVIMTADSGGLMWFRMNGEWYARFAVGSDRFSLQAGGPKGTWQLTDCIAELDDVEVEVMK